MINIKRRLWALIATAALLLSLSEARATILFAGGEDTSFTFVGSNLINTSVGTVSRTTYTREAWGSNDTAAADPPANRIVTPTFTAGSTVWFHAQAYQTTNAVATGKQVIILRSPDGVARILIRQTGTAGTLKASTRNAAATITDLATATGTFSATTLTQVDLGVVYGCTGGDTLKLYLNSVLVINYTGNLCTDAATQLNQAEFSGMNSNGGQGCNSAGSTCWSEVIVADEDTRGMALWTLAPVAAGNTQNCTPNTVGNVNPTSINDANFVSASASSTLCEWTTPTTAPVGTWGVKAVVQEARVRVGVTGPQTFEWLCRSGGTDNVTGSLSPTTSFGNFNNQIWANNCKTGSPWAIGDIATGFNLGIESTP